MHRNPNPSRHCPCWHTSSRSTSIKRSSSAQAKTRAKMRATNPSPSPRGGDLRGRTPPSSLARPARRVHSDRLRIITEEADPDRDSLPRPMTYTSLVPPTSPWNKMGRNMIGDPGSHPHMGRNIPHLDLPREVQVAPCCPLVTRTPRGLPPRSPQTRFPVPPAGEVSKSPGMPNLVGQPLSNPTSASTSDGKHAH